MPRSLDLERLKQFEPHPLVGQGRPLPLPPASAISEEQAHPPSSASPELVRWPSREPIQDGQISIKAPIDVIERFRTLCRDDRRTYADMLAILMDAFSSRER